MTQTEQNSSKAASLGAKMRSALLFFDAMGIEHPIDDFAHDRFGESEKLVELSRPSIAAKSTPGNEATASGPERLEARGSGQQTMPPRTTPSGPAIIPEASSELIAQAQSCARNAQSLDELRAALEKFDGLVIRKTAKSLVFGDGKAGAKLMLIGEAPGRDEDQQGIPFVGRSGQLLNKMLEAIGLAREDVYITNVIPWRPPGNRTPTPAETNACRPFIERHIELVRPEVLVFLGAASAQQLTGAKEGILRLRGRWLDYRLNEKITPALATLHPAYLLRSPAQKRLAWRDFLSVKKRLEEA